MWGGQQGYVFLPRKRKKWVENEAFTWPDDEEKIHSYLDRHSSSSDLYYTPNLFSQPDRRREYVQNPRWLYADLDAVTPEKSGLRPTIAVQSSPGRFQGLWKLARPIDPRKHEEYNQRLTYATGSDRGGWDLTQVLRIPGTQNHKYPGRITVRLHWSERKQFNLREVKRYLDGVEANAENLGPIIPPDLRLPSESSEAIRSRIGPSLDKRTQELLAAEDESLAGPEGRSGVLWELECRLLEQGLTPEEVFVVVQGSTWNKYLGRQDGDLQLWREVQKAYMHIGLVIPETLASANNGASRSRPRVLSYSDIMGSPLREPEWAIEGFWTMGSHGIVAGLPKSFKSLVSTDMAVALASQTPFLGQFEVNPRAVGPVLIVQQENSMPLLRDRLLKISHSRGLQTGSASLSSTGLEFQSPPSLPIWFYNDFGFDMTVADDRESIEATIRQLGIKTIFFDPLYLMIGGADENQGKEIRPVLQWLLRVRNLYNCAVVVIHHWGKGSLDKSGSGVGGIKLLGSTYLYGWLEAALYLEAKRSEDGVQVVVEREFRERPGSAPLAFTLSMGDIGELGYDWTDVGPVGKDNRILEVVSLAGPHGATLAEIRAAIGWGAKKTRAAIDELREEGILYEEKEGRQVKVFVKPGYEE